MILKLGSYINNIVLTRQKVWDKKIIKIKVFYNHCTALEKRRNFYLIHTLLCQVFILKN